MDKCYQCGASLPALGDCPKCHASRRSPSRLPTLLDQDLQLDRRETGPRPLVEGPTFVGKRPISEEGTRPPLGPIDLATQPSYVRLHDLPTQPGYIRMEKPSPAPARAAAPASTSAPPGLSRPLARPPPTPQRPPAAGPTPQRAYPPPPPAAAPIPQRASTQLPQRAPPPPPRPASSAPYDPAIVQTIRNVKLPPTPPAFAPDESNTDPVHPAPNELVFHSPPPPPVLMVDAPIPVAPKWHPPAEERSSEASRPGAQHRSETSAPGAQPSAETNWDELLTSGNSPSSPLEIRAEPASLWRRLFAFTVDLIVVGSVVALYLVVAAAVTGAGKRGQVVGLSALDLLMVRMHSLERALLPGAILAVVVALAYTAAFGMLWQGRTLGRKLLGIRLVDKTGHAPTPIRAVVRALLSLASVGLFFGGLWLALFDRRGQTLHDKLTSTFVVRPI